MNTADITLVCNYMKQDDLRHALNRLTRKTFGFDFESWHQSGYDEGQYIPYSFVKNGEVIANISANIMNMTVAGEKKNLIQLGTVMTDPEYRMQGLGRKLMEHVLDVYHEVDGIYLFANDSAIEFYKKFGFQFGTQYQCQKVYGQQLESNELRQTETKGEQCSLTQERMGSFVPVSNIDVAARKKFQDYVKQVYGNSAMYMDNYGVMMFWMSGMDNIYYSKVLDCYVAADITEDQILLYEVIAKHKVSLVEVFSNLQVGTRKVQLGFSPIEEEKSEFETVLYEEENCTYFYLGTALEQVEEKKLMFPLYSHT